MRHPEICIGVFLGFVLTTALVFFLDAFGEVRDAAPPVDERTVVVDACSRAVRCVEVLHVAAGGGFWGVQVDGLCDPVIVTLEDLESWTQVTPP